MSRPAAALGCALLALGLGCNGRSKETGSGPYVQRVTSTSAIVGAVTPDSVTLRLRVTASAGGASSLTEDPTPVQVHGLQASGLEPAQDYTYTLEGSDGVTLGSGSFHTAPEGATGSCVFLVTGDSGGTDTDEGELLDAGLEARDALYGTTDDQNRQADVVAAMLQRKADLVLHTGDLVYPTGAREDYAEAFFRPFGPLIANVPLYPTLGNHDLKTDGGAPYLETFFLPENGPGHDGRTYSFDWGPVHFVALDVVSSAYGSESEQVQWLERDVAAAGRPWTVVFFHVPPFSAYRGAADVLQGDLVEVLEELGVDLVLSGHDHHYARFFPRKATTFVVTGGGGKNLYRVKDAENLVYAESVFHFLEVHADATSLVLRALDLSGATFDELTIRKPR